jgi:hypothetical protein
MPIPVFPPKKDADLLSWAGNFSGLINTAPTTYGLTAAQATAFRDLFLDYQAAYSTAINPNTNSKANVGIKNNAKHTLLNATNGAWELVDIVQAFPGTTNDMREQLGLRYVDTPPTPIPAPAVAPDLSVVSSFARTIKVRLRDQENPDRRGKPNGVQGATVLYHVGETAPAEPSQWIFAMNTSRTVFDVDIPASVTAGSKVWLTAFWFNNRKEASPAATPESVRISEGLAQAA